MNIYIVYSQLATLSAVYTSFVEGYIEVVANSRPLTELQRVLGAALLDRQAAATGATGGRYRVGNGKRGGGGGVNWHILVCVSFGLDA